MPKNILIGVVDDLAAKVENATDRDRRAISLAVCKIAVSRSSLDAALVATALQLLQKGIYKDERITSALERLVEELDDSYFTAQSRFERGDGNETTYRELFSKARAANAVQFAFDADPLVAATHAIYEACAAVGTDATRTVVTRLLTQER